MSLPRPRPYWGGCAERAWPGLSGRGGAGSSSSSRRCCSPRSRARARSCSSSSSSWRRSSSRRSSSAVRSICRLWLRQASKAPLPKKAYSAGTAGAGAPGFNVTCRARRASPPASARARASMRLSPGSSGTKPANDPSGVSSKAWAGAPWVALRSSTRMPRRRSTSASSAGSADRSRTGRKRPPVREAISMAATGSARASGPMAMVVTGMRALRARSAAARAARTLSLGRSGP